MRQADPGTRQLARQLLAWETRNAPRNARALASAAEQAGDRLRAHLSPILGPAGFQALLSHALNQTAAEFPWLADAHVGPDGALNGLRAAASGQEPAHAATGYACLLAHVLGLLTAFVGEERTGQMVHQVWPDATGEAADFR